MDRDTRRSQAAQYILIDRNARYRLFPGALFDEYAWNMLLFLFIAYVNKQPMSERLLIASVKTSMNEGQRCLYELAKDGQVEARKSGEDVTLTAKSVERLREYLDSVHVGSAR